jgi:hypothetical protein
LTLAHILGSTWRKRTATSVGRDLAASRACSTSAASPIGHDALRQPTALDGIVGWHDAARAGSDDARFIPWPPRTASSHWRNRTASHWRGRERDG